MADKEVNKVIYGDDTLIDLTEDTVTEDTLAKGVTAHNAAGLAIEGTFEDAIQHIKVNGEEQPIEDNTVDIDVPTKVSELENDVPYATQSSLNSVMRADCINTIHKGRMGMLPFSVLDKAISEAPEQTLGYYSRGITTEITAQFVLLTELLGIEYEFSGFTITQTDGTEAPDFPEETYIYWDGEDYKTAVDGSGTASWVSSILSIEIVD